MNFVVTLSDVISITIFLIILALFVIYFVGGFIWDLISEGWKLIKKDWTGKD